MSAAMLTSCNLLLLLLTKAQKAQTRAHTHTHCHSKVWGQQGYFKEIFSNDALNWSIVKMKTMLQNISNYLFIKESLRSVTVSTKILTSTTVFNLDNNKKCFLSMKSACWNDFCGIM